jgi:hypothetical protein
LTLIQSHAPGIEAKERVRIARNDIVISPSFHVELFPTLGQGPQQRRLAALSDANNGDAGESPQIAMQQRLAGPFHTVHFETYALKMQAPADRSAPRISA